MRSGRVVYGPRGAAMISTLVCQKCRFHPCTTAEVIPTLLARFLLEYSFHVHLFSSSLVIVAPSACQHGRWICVFRVLFAAWDTLSAQNLKLRNASGRSCALMSVVECPFGRKPDVQNGHQYRAGRRGTSERKSQEEETVAIVLEV